MIWLPCSSIFPYTIFKIWAQGRNMVRVCWAPNPHVTPLGFFSPRQCTTPVPWSYRTGWMSRRRLGKIPLYYSFSLHLFHENEVGFGISMFFFNGITKSLPVENGWLEVGRRSFSCLFLWVKRLLFRGELLNFSGVNIHLILVLFPDLSTPSHFSCH